MTSSSRHLGLAASLLATAGIVVAPVQSAWADPETTAQLRINMGGERGAHTLTLGQGKAAVIDLPVAARDVLLSDPEVADAIVRTSQRVYVIGRKLGQTNIFFFDAKGAQIANVELRVEPDIRALENLIRTSVPTARVRAEAVSGSIVLTGAVRTASDADRVVRLAERFAVAPANGATGSASAPPLINMMTVEGQDQVLLKVRVVEMSRTLVKQLGVNLNGESILNKFLPQDTFVKIAQDNGYSVSGSLLGGLSGNFGVADNVLQSATQSVGGVFQGVPPGLFENGGQIDPRFATTGGFSFEPADPTDPASTDKYVFGGGEIVQKNKVDATVEAFERAGVVRVLAEPNITAISGESGKFLAGGEFPIPVGQDNGKISIEFKPFGVGLAYTPMVLSDGRISLKLAVEVSDLTPEGAIRTESIVIPALQVRRAETTVEMPSGGALVVAGLIQERTRSALEGVPGVKDTPMIGSLFRSRDFLNNQTELVIIVTPYLVKATSPDRLKTPLDGYEDASDLASLFSGHINRVYATPASDVGEKRLRGPLGFVLPRLNGGPVKADAAKAAADTGDTADTPETEPAKTQTAKTQTARIQTGSNRP
jgi:pilus assembly protein CpaC